MGLEVTTALGMTYGAPSIADALARSKASEADMLLVLPLFPQYSATTSAAAFDAVTQELRSWRSIPHFHFVRGYWGNPVYLGAIEQSIRKHWEKKGTAEHLIMSYHGLPLRYVEAGDPYMRHCDETTRLLTEALENDVNCISIAFQSRFGREPWLTPYTDLELIRLAEDKVKTVDIVCPGFAVDCLETLHEIAIEGDGLFKEHGGKTLRYISALNDSDHHVAALADVALSHLA
jgi:ferrochelatase